MVALDRDSAVAHQKGLIKMLIRTPKAVRTEMEPLLGIIKLYVAVGILLFLRPFFDKCRAMISFACVYDLLPAGDCLFTEAPRPNTLLRGIISRASLDPGFLVYKKETIECLLDVYEAISGLDHLVHNGSGMTTAEVDRILSFAKRTETTVFSESDAQYEPAERVNMCCQLSSQTFWKIVRNRRRFHELQSKDEIPEVQMILKHIQQLEPLHWIRNAPEIFTWIVFTGAAASTSERSRVAFVSYAGTVLTAIDAESLTLTRKGFYYFRWLRSLDKNRISPSVLEVKP